MNEGFPQDAYREEILELMLEGGQIIDTDWRYLYLNEVAARHARRKRRELLGLKMTELAAPFPLAGHDLRVTASIGFRLFPKDGDTVEALIGHGDIAMYRAKEEGATPSAFSPRR